MHIIKLKMSGQNFWVAIESDYYRKYNETTEVKLVGIFSEKSLAVNKVISLIKKEFDDISCSSKNNNILNDVVQYLTGNPDLNSKNTTWENIVQFLIERLDKYNLCRGIKIGAFNNFFELRYKLQNHLVDN